MNQLTTIAALPSGSGCAAALHAEEVPKKAEPTVQMKADYFAWDESEPLEWPVLENP